MGDDQGDNNVNSQLASLVKDTSKVSLERVECTTNGKEPIVNIICEKETIEKDDAKGSRVPSESGSHPGTPNLRDGTYLKFSSLTFGKELGRGGFGVVFKGKMHETPVAIKQLHFNVQDDTEFYHELSVMRRVRHPNCVLFLGATIAPDPMCIVTEFVGKGSLQDLIYNKNENLEKHNLLRYILDIARGMNYLHYSGIIHLDLKPDNVLVTESYACKVADFGLSKISGSYASSVTNKGGGTVVYTAPEVYRGERISNHCDVYSFGVMIWEMYYRQKPYAGMNQHAICFKVVSENLRPPVDEDNKPFYFDMMTDCWSRDITVRPTFDQLIKMIENLRENCKECVNHKSNDRLTLRRTFQNAQRPDDVNEWDEVHVISWLRSIDMDSVVDFFAGQNINGVVLKTLTNDDLDGLGISNFGHRRQLQIAIQELSGVPLSTNGSVTSLDSMATDKPSGSSSPEPIVKADKHINKHGCNRVTPGSEATCSFCDDPFEDYESGWECQTCKQVFHGDCLDEIRECEKPSLPEKSELQSDIIGNNSQEISANEKSPSMQSNLNHQSSFRNVFRRRMTIGLNPQRPKPTAPFSDFIAHSLRHVTGESVRREMLSVKSFFKAGEGGSTFKLHKRMKKMDEKQWEDVIISGIRVARSESSLLYACGKYYECYLASMSNAYEIIGQCQTIMNPVKVDFDAKGSETHLFNGDRDSIIQLATNIRDQLQAACDNVDHQKDPHMSIFDRATKLFETFAAIIQYLVHRERSAQKAKERILKKEAQEAAKKLKEAIK